MPLTDYSFTESINAISLSGAFMAHSSLLKITVRVIIFQIPGFRPVPTGTWEIRPSGMKRGACGNVDVLSSMGKLQVFGISLTKNQPGVA